MLDDVLVKTDVFDTDANRPGFGKGDVSVLPVAVPDAAVIAPGAHPSLGSQPQQGRPEVVRQNGIHLLGDGAKMDDRCPAPDLRNSGKIDPRRLMVNILNTTLVGINVFVRRGML